MILFKRNRFTLFLLMLLILQNHKVVFCQNYYIDLHNKISSGNYLGYLKYIEDNIEKREDYQNLAAAYSYVSEYKNSLVSIFKDKELYNYQLKLTSKINNLNLKYNIVKEDTLLKLIKENDIILFNEEHHKPYHRLYVKNMLKKLYDNGYRYLFIEALVNDKEINTRKYPILNNLTYKEPIFGNLLREALNLGYIVFCYDDYSSSSMQDRENKMANNIINKLDSLPKAKTLIFGGYSHISTKASKKINTLGFILFQKYKNVISIDQTTFSDNYDKKLTPSLYDSISKKIQHPVLISIKNDNDYDLRVIHPTTSFFKNTRIPEWYYDKQDTSLNIRDLINLKNFGSNTFLLQVYIKEEYEEHQQKSLPIFQMLISKKTKKVALPISKKSRNIVVIRNSEGKIILKETI